VVRLRDLLEGGVRSRRCGAIGLGAMHSYAVELALKSCRRMRYPLIQAYFWI
jgi:hypothetical protein